MAHSWRYEPEWMETAAGKHVGGFSCCRQCGLMRFSRPGYPPQHYYVNRGLLEACKASTLIRPGHPEVRNRAGDCIVLNGVSLIKTEHALDPHAQILLFKRQP